MTDWKTYQGEGGKWAKNLFLLDRGISITKG